MQNYKLPDKDVSISVTRFISTVCVNGETKNKQCESNIQNQWQSKINCYNGLCQ